MTRRFPYGCVAALVCGPLVALSAGCAAAGRVEPRESRPSTAASGAAGTEKPPVFTRNYMIYSVHHGRAEDLAETLDPVLKARYGPEARVVAHVPSNKLFIYIPPNRPQEQQGASRRRAARPRQQR